MRPRGTGQCCHTSNYAPQINGRQPRQRHSRPSQQCASGRRWAGIQCAVQLTKTTRTRARCHAMPSPQKPAHASYWWNVTVTYHVCILPCIIIIMDRIISIKKFGQTIFIFDLLQQLLIHSCSNTFAWFHCQLLINIARFHTKLGANVVRLRTVVHVLQFTVPAFRREWIVTKCVTHHNGETSW